MDRNPVHNEFLNTLTMGTAFPRVPLLYTFLTQNKKLRVGYSPGCTHARQLHEWNTRTSTVRLLRSRPHRTLTRSQRPPTPAQQRQSLSCSIRVDGNQLDAYWPWTHARISCCRYDRPISQFFRKPYANHRYKQIVNIQQQLQPRMNRVQIFPK